VKVIAGVLLLIALVAGACTGGAGVAPAPALDEVATAQLQARAFMRACQDVICAGAPIYAPASTPEPVRAAILSTYTDEVRYLSESQVEERTNADGRFADGAILIDAGSVHGTERDNVVAVDVGLSRGFRDYVGRTYLFVWNGTEWADTSADAVDVSTTSSVS